MPLLSPFTLSHLRWNMEEENVVKLKVTVSHGKWIAYGDGYEKSDTGLQEAKVGPFPQTYFSDLVIESVESGKIVITNGTMARRELTPGESVSFFYEREGREWSDGCVCDGDSYEVVIRW